ncbi:MAG: radical SAM protein [Crenarchaeota archaeon]|nr:radical SAM protein [Thermoproteota archaeon]
MPEDRRPDRRGGGGEGLPGLKGYDPVELADRVEARVCRDSERMYYRFRAARFYGGIATGDVMGCNLRCIFCWSMHGWAGRTGRMYTAWEAWEKLRGIARSRGYRRVRLSGGEPTIGFRHLEELIGYADSEGYLFILETNGILIGARREYARRLSAYNNLHVRVSIKACSPEWFHRLTGARPEAWRYQIEALKNLADYGVSHHAAIILGFGDKQCYRSLVEALEEADPGVTAHLEPEVIVMYPSVERRLRAAGLWPTTYARPP